MHLAFVSIAGSLLAIAPAPALAQATACPKPVVVPGWSNRSALAVTASATRIAASQLSVGTAADAHLRATPQVAYVTRPEKLGGPASYGGMLGFDVARAGTYRVSLGSSAWIDVLRDGKPIASVNHGHGPACTGIRKIVDFPLKPGRHVLQIAGSGEAILPIQVVRLP